MPDNTSFNPKVVIYGVGFVGQTLVRLVASKGWKIVAAYNRAGDKVGQDVGRASGLNRDLGVVIQDCETADYSNLSADIALVATVNTLEGCASAHNRLLSAGINVLCHSSEAYSPRWFNPQREKELNQLARENGVTFSGGGIWDMSRLWSGVIAAGPCVKIDSLLHTSATEVARQGVWGLRYFGAGLSMQEWQEQIGGKVGAMNFYHVPAALVLGKLGYTVTHYNAYMEPMTWDEDFYSHDLKKEIQAGHCIGSLVCVDVETEEGVNARCEIQNRLFKDGEEEFMRWRINGKPGMEITVVREDSGLASASSFFNRIPDVIAAPPGLVEVLDLTPLKPSVLL